MIPLFLIRWSLLANSDNLGKWGERYCELLLKRRGFKGIARNFSIYNGEIDLVMADGDAIVFVEVKTRANENFAKAQDSVDRVKQQKIIKAAKYFIGKYGLRGKVFRFDVAAVVLGEKGKPEFRYYENAFSGFGR